MLLVENDDADWLESRIQSLPDEKVVYSVSKWAVEKRYLPTQVTNRPGPYSFHVTPFLEEIADCMSADSPIRTVDFMKGAQVGATVGILENTVGYLIEHVKAVPSMLLTADQELAELRLSMYITPMLQHSGLLHLIKPADENNRRKTGHTKKLLEWEGPGYLIPFGAQNADKLRMISIRYLLQDEVDAFPKRVGKDGDPQSLAEARQKSYDETKKNLRISTPLIKGQSRIERGHDGGDQRKYFVPCKSCGHRQVLRFRKVNKETGQVSGITWKTDDAGNFVIGSARYVCEKCGQEHANHDKVQMLARGEWRPTATCNDPTRRSYHLSGLYSPVGFFSWDSAVLAWFEAWDVKNDQVKDVEKLQEFYNNVLGESFEQPGAKIQFKTASSHRRPEYRLGEVPNAYAQTYAGGEILFVTCQIDVHKSNLAVATMGWTKGGRCFVLDYWRFQAPEDGPDCDDLDCPVWQEARELITNKVYAERYKIVTTLIDAGYTSETVATFAAEFGGGVFPIVGRPEAGAKNGIREFSEYTTQSGVRGYKLNVDYYKDRNAVVLRRQWTEAAGLQPERHFNAPIDLPDKVLKELTVEVKREEIDERGHTKQVWYRPGNARNELWDLLGYGHACVDIIAAYSWIELLENDAVDMAKFWEWAADAKNDRVFARLS